MALLLVYSNPHFISLLIHSSKLLFNELSLNLFILLLIRTLDFESSILSKFVLKVRPDAPTFKGIWFNTANKSIVIFLGPQLFLLVIIYLAFATTYRARKFFNSILIDIYWKLANRIITGSHFNIFHFPCPLRQRLFWSISFIFVCEIGT